MKILITGSAGFIGFHTAMFFLKKGNQVFGIDNFDNYYDVKLKKDRNKILLKFKNYHFKKIDIRSFNGVKNFFKKNNFNLVIHLAAQAGVRYSLNNPKAYISTNLVGFFNIIENCKNQGIKKFIYASSSSVYGENKKKYFSEIDRSDKPIQLYAATKKSNELIAHAYSSLYKIKTIGLRFFTVYGPWGRPDMSLFDFVKDILNKKKINIYNHGKHSRDFTYIDDIVQGIFLTTKKINETSNATKKNIYTIFNIANGQSIKLINFIKIIEKKLKLNAKKNFKTLQKGDVVRTAGSIKKIKKILNYKPITKVEKGVSNFVDWYLEYKKIK